MNDSKIFEAQATLQLAADMSAYYYHEPLIVCYSGGKDSDVLLDLARKCLKPSEFEVLNSHTTVDAPETVYHIRDVFKELEKEGIKATVKMPIYKGEHTSMWKLIVDKGIPPTRVMRYCCKVLKEASTPNRMAAVGVREAESIKRRGRDVFAVLAPRYQDAEYRSLQHTNTMFLIDKKYQDKPHHECALIEAAKSNKDTLVNPIYHWTDADVWAYIRESGIKTNPLYAKGYKRVGCIGCPLSKNQKKELEAYPKYKLNYIKAFDRMLRERERRGARFLKYDLKTGEEVYRWWLGDDPKQVRIEDILEE